MKERRLLVKALAGDYRRARKKEKGEMLDRFVVATVYSADDHHHQHHRLPDL